VLRSNNSPHEINRSEYFYSVPEAAGKERKNLKENEFTDSWRHGPLETRPNYGKNLGASKANISGATFLWKLISLK